MKKKIKDLTIEEMINICKTHPCATCPFNDHYNDHTELCEGICLNEKGLELDREVEL